VEANAPAAGVAKGVAEPKGTEAAPKEELKQPEQKKYKVKINGKESELDEATLIRMAQMGGSAQEKFQRVAHLEKLEKAIESGDHRTVRKLMGDDRFHKISVEYFNERLAEEEMSPKERELKKREEALREHEDKQKSEREERESKQMQALEDYYAEKFDTEFVSAMKESGLPQTPFVVKRMAELMQLNLTKNINASPAQIAKIVKDEARSNIKQLLKSLPEDELASELGEDVEELFRKRSMKKLGNPLANNKAPHPSQQKSERKKEESKPMTKAEWKERMERIKAGKE
jgi:hypothetical protein